MTTRTTKNGKPSTSQRSVRGLLPGKGSPPASSIRRAVSGSQGLLAQVKAPLPGVARNAKQSGPQKFVAALGQATRSTAAHKPSTRRTLGILATGVGAVAVAKRRHHPDQPDLPSTGPGQPVQALEATTPRIVETTIEPISMTGGDHGDPQGPDSAAAA